MFFCEFCGIFKNTHYEGRLRTAASFVSIIDLDFIDAKKKIETDVSQCHYHASIYSFSGFAQKFRIVKEKPSFIFILPTCD